MINRDDVIRMAREAGFSMPKDEFVFAEMIDHFAHLIASHVAEECAKACENLYGDSDASFTSDYEKDSCAAAIRSLYKPTA